MNETLGSLMQAALPAMIVARGSDDSQPPMGLGEPFALMGGDRLHAGGIPFLFGHEWQPSLRNVVIEACEAALEAQRVWFRMPPCVLVAEPGVGRTHAARCLAHAMNVPHVILNLADPVVANSLSRPGIFREALAVSPIVAMMAAKRIANPVVSVVGVGVHPDADAVLADMIDPETSHAWHEHEFALDVDLGEVSWLVQVDEGYDLPAPIEKHLTLVPLEHDPAREQEVVLSVALEVLRDLGLSPSDPVLEITKLFTERSRFALNVSDLYAQLWDYFVEQKYQHALAAHGLRGR
jgi:hypothetical protein